MSCNFYYGRNHFFLLENETNLYEFLIFSNREVKFLSVLSSAYNEAIWISSSYMSSIVQRICSFRYNDFKHNISYFYNKIRIGLENV